MLVGLDVKAANWDTLPYKNAALGYFDVNADLSREHMQRALDLYDQRPGIGTDHALSIYLLDPELEGGLRPFVVEFVSGAWGTTIMF